jgi:lysophospholipase L1-like esterase
VPHFASVPTRFRLSARAVLTGTILGTLAFAVPGPAAGAADPAATKPAATKRPAAKAAADPAKPDPMKPVADVAGLPRVLLIGDSISIGYTLPTREKLAGKANVHRPPTNCSATPKGVTDLDKWLGDPAAAGGKWDVVHFNWGLHDLKHVDEAGTMVAVDKGKQNVPVAEYEANLRKLVTRLKATGATLVWASTTPVPAGAKGRVTADVPTYNAAAAKVMADEKVATDDLFAFVTPRQAEIQRKADVHYTPAGYDALAAQVAATVEKALAERKATAAARPAGQ